ENDEGHTGETVACHVQRSGLQMNRIKRGRNSQWQMGVVGEQWSAARGVRAADGPPVRAWPFLAVTNALERRKVLDFSEIVAAQLQGRRVQIAGTRRDAMMSAWAVAFGDGRGTGGGCGQGPVRHRRSRIERRRAEEVFLVKRGAIEAQRLSGLLVGQKCN